MTRVIYLLFLLSGSCGLIYQVVWTRMLTHILGSTVLAVSTVLAAFMSGLALGSYLLGKRGDRGGHPLKQYAIYEVGIGLGALLALLLLSQLTPVYLKIVGVFGGSSVLLTGSRFILVFAVILLPTTLMGATLPILSRLMITRFDHAGRTLSGLYAANTVGAVAGCLLAGFYLIGNVGTHNAIYLGAVLNVLVGVASWLLAKRLTKSPVEPPEKKSPRPAQPNVLPARSRWLLFGGLAVSGVASLSYEVFWARSLVFYLGNSTYAFTTMLTAFLVGIALGGFFIRFVIDRTRQPLAWFASIQIGIGICAGLAMPAVTAALGSSVVRDWFEVDDQQWQAMILLRFGIAFAVMLVPTILIGTTFPLAGRVLLRDLHHTSGDIGRAYAANTAGNIVGAILPALVVLPLFGLHRGILFMAAINVMVGVVVLVYARERVPVWRHLIPVGAVAAAVLVLILSSAPPYPADTQEPGDKVLYYEEGPAATTKVYVKRATQKKHIAVDGIHIGGSDPAIDFKQQWLAHLPKLLLDDYRSELSVGLGSGILIGESARHARIEQITCVEIAPSVVRAARYFEEENYGILHSPRARVVVADGVNFLLTTTERFDIISTDGKTQPEYSSNGVFFSKEYYALMRDRLTAGGLAIQWIPLHYPPDVFKTILSTCAGAFPHVQLWFSEQDCFLVASKQPIMFDADAIDRKLADGSLPFDGLRKFGVTSADALLSHLIATEDVIKAHTADAAENSIERPIVEFYDYQEYAVPEMRRKLENLEFILAMRGKGNAGEMLRALPPGAMQAYQAEGAFLNGFRAVLSEQGRSHVQPHFDQALTLDPDNQDVRYHVAGIYLQTVRDLMQAERYAQAQADAQRVVELTPQSAEARHRLGFILKQQGRLPEAIEQFEAAVNLEPKRTALRHQLASHYISKGRFEPAIEQLRHIVDIDPEDTLALNNLGYLLVEMKQHEEGVGLLQRAYAIDPKDPAIIDSYAWALFQTGEYAAAKQIVQQAGDYYTGSRELTEHRNRILNSPSK